jgi:tetratricopeptide (TPR) repeat protein
MWRRCHRCAGILAVAAALAAGLAGCRRPAFIVQQALSAYRDDLPLSGLDIQHPFDEALFPRDIAPPLFLWEDKLSGADAWLVVFELAGRSGPLAFLSRQHQWRPTADDWNIIKQHSLEQPARIAIVGFKASSPHQILTGARIRLATSTDAVDAPIFYREVPLPFIDAVRDPARIRWRFGSVATSDPPRVVLENLPVCGNCHSFDRQGEWLAMDVDYANNKGSYVITPVGRQMELTPRDIITWDDYRKQDGDLTFGLLSQISPDGRHVLSTVKDKSVFVATPGLEFSQLFFPIKGILVYYQRETRSFHALPGADDPRYVQSNPTWSPDGRQVLFARSEAYALRRDTAKGKVLLLPEDCEEFVKEGKPFKFDLYRLAFNDGRGGKPEPLAGASGDGFSNFFPKYSPDGRWIVFCKAKDYMLLQPNSELYIMPAAGGEPRKLRANRRRMNSWHSWSPNGRWLVFSSKHFGPYTQLLLTHIDPDGNSAPPVWLDRFTASDRAANIPEFVNRQPDAIASIRERFVDDISHLRAGYALDKSGDADGAIKEYRQALAANPRNADAHQRLGFLLYNVKQNLEEGLRHTREAVKLDPAHGRARYDLGMALFHQEQYDQALEHLQAALQHLPDGAEKPYLPAAMRFSLGLTLLLTGDYSTSEQFLARAVEGDNTNAEYHYFLALAQAHQGNIAEPAQHYATAVKLQPSIDHLPELPDLLGINCSLAGQYSEARNWAQRALKLAQAARNEDMINAILERMKRYEQHQPYPMP